MFHKCLILGLCVIVSVAFAQQNDRINLGTLQTGATVSFVRFEGGKWGIETSGGNAPSLIQQKPVQIEIFQGQENTQQIAAGYDSVEKESNSIIAKTKVASAGDATFEVEDKWKISGAVLSLSRKVSVTSAEENAGFYSAIQLSTAPIVKWEDVNCLVPGLLYGNSSYAGGRAPTSISNYRAKRFEIREDYMSAPLLGVSFQDGNWAAVLDIVPRGDTTQEESTASATTAIIDERIQFGALIAKEVSSGGIELGFRFPGTTTEFGSRGGRRGAPTGGPGSGW